MSKQKKRGQQTGASERNPAASTSDDGDNGASAKRITDAKQTEQIGELKTRVARGEKYMIALTFAMVVTGVLQWFLTREQVRDARRALEIEQRAWVVVHRVDGPPVTGEALVPSITLRNAGETPARNLHIRFRAHVIHRDKPLPLPVENSDAAYTPVDTASDSRSMMPADAQSGISQPITVTIGGRRQPLVIGPKEWEALESGEYKVYMWGRVTYDDIFKRPHWMRFCYVWRADQGGYGPCERHNDDDDA